METKIQKAIRTHDAPKRGKQDSVGEDHCGHARGGEHVGMQVPT
jgi:hypothetical protein